MNIRFEPLHGKEETALGKAIICCAEDNLHNVKEKILGRFDSKRIPYFMTQEDIFRSTKFKQELNKASCGIITLTPKSINSPCILFESGVLIGRKIPIIPFIMDVSGEKDIFIKQLPRFIEQYQLVEDIDALIDIVNTHIYKFYNIFGKEYEKLNNKILNKLNQVKLTLFLENVDKDLQNDLRFGFQIIRFGTWNLIKNEPKYLFSWDEVPGNDNKRLLEYLKQNFNIDWVKFARVEKFDDNRTIKISGENNSLSIRLNDEKTEAKLEIEDGRTDIFLIKTENGILKIKNSEMDETDRVHKINFIDKISYELNTDTMNVEYILPVHRKWGLTFKLFVDIDNLEKLNTMLNVLKFNGYENVRQSGSGEKQRIYFLIPGDKCKIVEEPDKISNNYLNPFVISDQQNNFQNV